MTGEEFRAARLALGLTQAELAQDIESDVRTVRRWENSEREIPGPARVAIRLLSEAHAAQPFNRRLSSV